MESSGAIRVQVEPEETIVIDNFEQKHSSTLQSSTE
jgi:hypothetical protein